MERGKVKWFSPEKGYGFISNKEERDVFVHHTDIVGKGFRMLVEEEWVEFELVKTDRGFRARNVKRLGFNPNTREEERVSP